MCYSSACVADLQDVEQGVVREGAAGCLRVLHQPGGPAGRASQGNTPLIIPPSSPSHTQAKARLILAIVIDEKTLSSRKWVGSRSSKTRFRESSPTRRSVKTVLTGERGPSTALFPLLMLMAWGGLSDPFLFFCCTQVRARRNLHGVEPRRDVLPKPGDLPGPVCEGRGAGGQQRLLLREVQGEGA